MKNEKGVTMIALIITITILAIIAFTILYTARGVDENIDNDMLIQELNQVHHIVLEEYNKKITLGNEYIYIDTPSLGSNENTCITTLSTAGKINRYCYFLQVNSRKPKKHWCKKCNIRIFSMLR